MLHLVDGQARIETKLDHMHDRLSRVEEKQSKPRWQPRSISEYMPAVYGVLLIIAVVSGKLTILQMLQAIKGP
jgi:flagellar motor component MotA